MNDIAKIITAHRLSHDFEAALRDELTYFLDVELMKRLEAHCEDRSLSLTEYFEQLAEEPEGIFPPAHHLAGVRMTPQLIARGLANIRLNNSN